MASSAVRSFRAAAMMACAEGLARASRLARNALNGPEKRAAGQGIARGIGRPPPILRAAPTTCSG